MVRRELEQQQTEAAAIAANNTLSRDRAAAGGRVNGVVRCRPSASPSWSAGLHSGSAPAAAGPKLKIATRPGPGCIGRPFSSHSLPPREAGHSASRRPRGHSSERRPADHASSESSVSPRRRHRTRSSTDNHLRGPDRESVGALQSAERPRMVVELSGDHRRAGRRREWLEVWSQPGQGPGRNPHDRNAAFDLRHLYQRRAPAALEQRPSLLAAQLRMPSRCLVCEQCHPPVARSTPSPWCWSSR